MAKKKRAAPAMPDQPLRREAIEPQLFIDAMRRLLASEDFKLLRRFWASERIGILERGKDKPSLEEWAVLKGFDSAIVVPELYAHKTTGADLMRQRHAELMEALHGDHTK